MYRSASPYQPHEAPYQARPYSPVPGAAPIVPGAITYTTSVGSDGRTIYHPFKAVPASYQTPGGVVTGIQWVPAEATQILPPGAQPATADFAASWGRGQLGKEDERTLGEWGREEDKRRRKEEKEAKRLREQGRGDYDPDLRKARDRDAQARERRRSFNANAPDGGYAFPTSGASGYPGPGYPPTQYSGYGDRPAMPGGAPSYATSSGGGAYPRDSKYGYSDVDRQFGDMDIRDRDRGYPGERERKNSRPTKYNAGEAGGDRPRTVSGNLGPRPEGYDSSPYGTAGPYGSSMRAHSGGSGPAHSPNMRAASPNPRAVEGPYVPPGMPGAGYPSSNYSSSPAPRAQENIARSTTPFGSGAPPGAFPRSRPTSPMPVPTVSGRPITPAPPTGPYSAGSVNFPQTSPSMPAPTPVSGAPTQQLAAPTGFSRPVNGTLAFPPFDIIKVQDMDKFWSEVPRMPPVLKPHDVFEEDWGRLMQDIALAWAGKLPVLEYSPTGRQPKRSSLIQELVDLWNNAFFHVRGVELILYKGNERRSGPHVGRADKNLPYLDQHDDYLSSSSQSEDTDDSDSDYGRDRYHNVYGYSNSQQPLTGVFEAGRLRKEAKLAAKAERRKRRQERHRKRRERYRDRKYSLYLTCLSGAGPAPGGHAGPMNPGMPHPAAVSGYGMRGGYTPGGY